MLHLDDWKEKLQAAFGPNGQVLTEFIPELEAIIGTQSNAQKLNPLETQNLLFYAVRSLIEVFTEDSLPLVLFLDDLQWAENSTLGLLEYLVTTNELSYLLIIVGYRDNEVKESDPLNLMLEEIRKQKLLTTVSLKSLSKDSLTRFLSDTLNQIPDEICPLADILFRSTGGNPFYFKELLKELVQESTLFFDYKLSRWNWDSTKINTDKISLNVIEFLTLKLEKLSRKCLESLKKSGVRW